MLFFITKRRCVCFMSSQTILMFNSRWALAFIQFSGRKLRVNQDTWHKRDEASGRRIWRRNRPFFNESQTVVWQQVQLFPFRAHYEQKKKRNWILFYCWDDFEKVFFLPFETVGKFRQKDEFLGCFITRAYWVRGIEWFALFFVSWIAFPLINEYLWKRDERTGFGFFFPDITFDRLHYNEKRKCTKLHKRTHHCTLVPIITRFNKIILGEAEANDKGQEPFLLAKMPRNTFWSIPTCFFANEENDFFEPFSSPFFSINKTNNL